VKPVLPQVHRPALLQTLICTGAAGFVKVVMVLELSWPIDRPPKLLLSPLAYTIHGVVPYCRNGAGSLAYPLLGQPGVETRPTKE